MKRFAMCLAVLICIAQGELALSFNVLAPDDFIIAIDTDLATNSGSPASGNESASKAIDNSIDTKYLNFATTRTGFIVTPGTTGAVQSFVITTGNDAVGRDPSSYELYGTNETITTPDHLNGRDQEWTLISQGPLSLPGDVAIANDQRKVAGAPVGFANGTAYSSYKMIFPTTKTANSIMQFAEIGLFASTDGSGTDLTMPGNTIIPIQDIDHFSRSNFPANEPPSRAIDRVVGGNNKYLNFGRENSGFIVTPSGKTVVNGFSITTAGDVAGRDPGSYEIWGTNDEIDTLSNGLGNLEEYTLIASGTLNLPTDRGASSGEINFPNTTSYSSYKVVFPTVRGPTTDAAVNSMQIGEFELHAADVSALVINRSGPDAGKGYIRADINLAVAAYEIRSDSGLLNPAGWTSITSSGSDPGDDWQVTSATVTSIGEQDGPGGANNGVTLAAGSQLNLGSAFRVVPTFLADGVTPTGWEQVLFRMYDPAGNLIGGEAEFVGDPVPWGDYNGDGLVDIGDWPLFRAGLGGSFVGMNAIDAYLSGDLDGDLDSDLDDFHVFVDMAGGMSALFGNPVPEPSSIALVGLAGMVLLARRRVRGWIAGAAALFLAAMPVASEAADLQFQVVLPNPFVSIPEGQENENTGTVDMPAYSSPDNMFDDIPLNDSGRINIDLFTLDYEELEEDLGQYAIGGEMGGVQDSAVIFMDYGTSISANWFAYSQRTGGNPVADKVGKFEFWFSNTDFAGVPPTTAPQATFELLPGDSRIDDSIIRPYTLGGQHSGRYVAMRMTETAESGALTTTSRIGGHEFRLLQGPSDIVVDVNRATGEITLRNNLPGAASINMQAYSIESPSGSLDPAAFNGVGGNGPFSLGNGSGNGWEVAEGSTDNRLIEAFFSGQTQIAGGAAPISLGNAYQAVGGVEDLVFKWTNAAEEVYNARVVYSGTAPLLGGDYNNDGMVNLADYTVWRDNLGASITLPGDTTPGTVTAADYTVWKNNFGLGGGPVSGLASTNVPEPSTLLLIAAAAVPLVCRRRAS